MAVELSDSTSLKLAETGKHWPPDTQIPENRNRKNKSVFSQVDKCQYIVLNTEGLPFASTAVAQISLTKS